MEPKVSGETFTVQTVRSLQEVESLREVWQTWRKTRDSDLDFFTGIVQSRGNGCVPHVLVLRRDGKLEALLVGLQGRRRIPVRLGSVTLLQPEVCVLEFVRGGLLGNASAANCKVFVRTVMQSLKQGAADLAVWEHLNLQSSLYLTATRLPGIGLRDHCRKLRDHWFLDHPRGLEDFFQSVARSQRSKLRRKYKKFLHTFAGRIHIRDFHTISELDDAIRDMEEIARNSVKRQLGFGFFDTPRSRNQLRVEAEQGWLRIFVLYIDGMPVSFWKGTLYGRFLHADHVGFDSTWSEYSPGIFLFLEIVERLRDCDIECIDFGTGTGQFYQSFAKVRRLEARVQIFAPKLRGLGLNLACTLAHHATLMIQRTSWLDWPRKTLWKARRSALAPAATMPTAGDSVEPHAPVLYDQR
jgi:Acetyltransferase (GNAT) domain